MNRYDDLIDHIIDYARKASSAEDIEQLASALWHAQDAQRISAEIDRPLEIVAVPGYHPPMLHPPAAFDVVSTETQLEAMKIESLQARLDRMRPAASITPLGDEAFGTDGFIIRPLPGDEVQNKRQAYLVGGRHPRGDEVLPQGDDT